MHDPRVGRFFARDPLEKYYAEQTPYQFSSNAPIHAFELEGMETSFDLRFKHRERRYLSGEISAEEFKEENNAEGKGAVAGVLIVAAYFTGGRTLPLLKTLFWRGAFEITKRQALIVASGNFAIGFFDEGNQIQTPGPIDDFGRGTRLVIGNFLNNKFIPKFILPKGKLDFGLGEGSTVLKDLAKVTKVEIDNMAKSLIRGKKFKEQGIDSTEKLAGLASKAFSEGVDVGKEFVDKNGRHFKKQVELADGTKVNVNFIQKAGEELPQVSSFSIPDVNKSELGRKIKELTDRAIELGNKELKKTNE